MAKGHKLQLPFLSSFQICRPKDPTSWVKDPLPTVTYMFSPVSSKSFDISFLSFPNPPPTTPNQHTSKRNPASSKIAPLGYECRSRSCMMQGKIDDEFSTHRYSKTIKESKEKMYNSPVSSDSDERDWPIAPSRIEKKKGKTKKKKSKASINTSSEETNTLFSSPPSFNSSHDYSYPLKTIIKEEPLNQTKKTVNQKSVRARRSFKHIGSKEWKDDDMTVPLHESTEKRAVSGRLVPCIVDGKVNQSFVVVKRSVDPYEDFKKSMLEMILDKQMFEPKELEELLMSFLSLNSRLHHKVIIEAFTEVWREVYCGS